MRKIKKCNSVLDLARSLKGNNKELITILEKDGKAKKIAEEMWEDRKYGDNLGDNLGGKLGYTFGVMDYVSIVDNPLDKIITWLETLISNTKKINICKTDKIQLCEQRFILKKIKEIKEGNQL